VCVDNDATGGEDGVHEDEEVLRCEGRVQKEVLVDVEYVRREEDVWCQIKMYPLSMKSVGFQY